MQSQSNPVRKWIWTGLVISVILTALYFYLYQYYPLPDPWNDVYLTYSVVLASIVGAWLATLVMRKFNKDELPHAIWKNFAIGLWMWAIAEVIWSITLTIWKEVPVISLADLPWVAAYVFFGLAIVHQYHLLNDAAKKRENIMVAAVVLIVLVVSALITIIYRTLAATEQSWADTFMVVFYPVADLAVAVPALLLASKFGRGSWGRIWAGLLLFVVSDAVYSWLTFTGVYAFSVETGNIWSLISDSLYLVAYLVIAMACLSQYLLLLHGKTEREREPIQLLNDIVE